MAGAGKARRKLTARQVEILVLLARGGTYKTIASRLGVTEATVGYHLARLHRLFDTSPLVGLVTTAIVYGILSAGTLPIDATGQTLIDP